MINSLWKSPAELDHQIPGRRDSQDSVMSRLGGRNVFIFCSSRMWRGTPKLLLQITAIFFTSFLIFGILPDRLSGGQLGSGYRGMFPWGSYEPEPDRNLRVVVFGSPDVVGNVHDPSSERKAWTEELCDELECTSYLSFVPKAQPNRGLISNDMYEETVKDLLNTTKFTNVKEKPALNYKYIAKNYPTPSKVPDLASQVQSFLAMPPPEETPRETVWVFSFGTWEIWNMAAMPRQESEDAITYMVRQILDQAEILYERSLDPTSIAYSDFWTNATESQASELTAPGALDKVDRRKFESFRIIVPTIFDISLTPGWQGRKTPPAPNNVVEQTRNAAELTKYWNQEVDFAVAEWKERTTKKPKRPTSSTGTSDKTKRAESVEPVEHSEDTKESAKSTYENQRVIQAPYPMRNGLLVTIDQGVLDAMTEGDMERAAVVDLRGRGTLSANDSMRFADVWTPCVRGDLADLKINEKEIKTECEIERDHLFYDSFTISERAMKNVVKAIMGDVREELFNAEEKRGWLYGGW
ncbi:hypothetical protein HYE67_004641 [Fusarium culmorum]|uniref:Uncharacterized protein n=1 Tax=Fusarium culmorum TaxID=5516 RepID=A0A2T4GZS4_FUSCU|nr:hypothetical protein FCULG_00010702 [Fusarium culmorum]QPC62410.1 hypothetical protein HYE67_004641 [Fusarium culmorum]